MKVDRRRGFAFPDHPQATRDDVRLLMHDRPPKFTGETAAFKQGGGSANGYPCGKCFHMYDRTSGGRSVCEITRPSGDPSIAKSDTCRLWTSDGVRYPLLAGGDKAMLEDIKGRIRY